MNENAKTNSKKSLIKNYIQKTFTIQNLKKQITVKNFIKLIVFVVMCILYYKAEMASRAAGQSKEILTIGSRQFPVSSLSGVYTAIMTIILIAWVLVYKRFGFAVSFTILTVRTTRLIGNFMHSHYHASILPALFITFAAIVSVILVYIQYEMMQHYQVKHKKQMESFNNSIMEAFSECVESKDAYTKGHSQRVAVYTKMLAQRLGESKETVKNFYNVAILHDIGKIGMPEAILNKAGKLTPEEYEIVKKHPVSGYEILKNVKIQEDIAAGAHYHHERWDGKGYPDGLKETDIPWVARIISVADTFDAMSSTRPYREKLPLNVIAEEIDNCSGTQFDPKVVKAFLSLYLEGAFDELV